MKYFILTYGCQMNESDSELMAGYLEKAGYIEAASEDEADFILVNTCCVRKRPEERALGKLTELKRHKARGAILAVSGCLAQKEKEKLFELIPHLDIVMGTQDLDQVVELFEEARKKKEIFVRTFPPYNGLSIKGSFSLDRNEFAPVLPRRSRLFSGYITIMRGCNNYCSYCIVPYVRGREVSRPHDEILNETEDMLEKGYREITLLGQNVNSYLDNSGLDFAGLLKKILGRNERFWLRFITSHPRDLRNEVIELFATYENLAPHIHLPVQSGSDLILEKMNRYYKRKDYLELVRKLRKARPDIAITTDLIAGFPGETEKDFEETLSLMEEVRFDTAFMFYFTPREGTPAASMPGLEPEEIRLERLRRMIALQMRITSEINQQMVGKKMKVLIEGPARKAGTGYTARAASNRVVIVEALEDTPLQPGSFLDTIITEGRNYVLKARLCDSKRGA